MVRRKKQRELRLRDFDRLGIAKRARWVVLLDRTVDLLCTKTARRIYLTLFVMLALTVAKHQRVIENTILAGNQTQRMALAVPAQWSKDLTDYQREKGLTQWQRLHRWDARVTAAAKRFGVKEAWIRAVMIQESGGYTMMAEGKKIVSNKGAMGLMQLMPDTYAELRKLYRLGSDPHNPDDNIAAGAVYLSWLHGRYGKDMFAAYNAGPGTLEASRATGAPLPLETQNYVVSIAALLRRPDLMKPAPAPETDKPMLVSSLEDAWDAVSNWWMGKGNA